MATTLPCPICDRPVKARSENRSFPFCSDRCRLVDLGKWLGETYRVPGPYLGDAAEAPPREAEREEDES